jgi:aspartyl-tRNA(Asn)/glutamyl-tRNA(Gln) amidotransferase subunit A
VQPPLRTDKIDVERIAVPQESLSNLSPAVKTGFDSALQELREAGMEVKEVAMPSLRFALPAYYILATSEASTNLARYCGMRFGVRGTNVSQHFNDFFSEVRSEHFGQEAKRRILLGTYARMVGFRDRYYLKALSVRQSIIDDYSKVFEKNDLVLTPTMPFIAPRFSEIAGMRPLEVYQADFLTVPPNLAGLPHLSVPCAYSGCMPIGMQFVAPHWEEARLLEIADVWTSRFELRFPEVRA